MEHSDIQETDFSGICSLANVLQLHLASVSGIYQNLVLFFYAEFKCEDKVFCLLRDSKRSS